jgi:hypothetical protein
MSFFFTLLDDSLRPRGSRDPLGTELLWSRVGRKLVGNLTTVTAHLDNFILTLVGFHLCIDQKGGQTDWVSFERFEQLTARARVARSLEGVIGVRRIRRSEGFPVPLGAGTDARILDDQRQAGLWGLYSSALAASGLTDGMRLPTPRGAEIARMFLASAPDNVWHLALDKQVGHINEKQMGRAADWVAALLGESGGRKALADCLLSGGDKPEPWQGEVFSQGRKFMTGKVTAPPARDFLLWLTEQSPTLQNYATRVLQFDEALVLATLSFDWLLGCHGRTAKQIEEQMSGLVNWPFRSPSIPDFSAEITDGEWHRRTRGLEGFCSAMAAGDSREATERLFAHHASVAKARGGAPWCYWEGDQIKVVMSTTPGTLPMPAEISADAFTGWMRTRSNGFFLDSFLAILNQTQAQKPVEGKA